MTPTHLAALFLLPLLLFYYEGFTYRHKSL